jgi:hydrogenase expression/formation protein HypD
MKYISEFRDHAAAQGVVRQIRDAASRLEGRKLKIMEVCGGHTMAIFNYGIPALLPENIELISGPGCPVCVTANSFLDTAIAMARLPDVIITSFGDLLRVPGSHSSLLKEKSAGHDVRVCYSSLDALEIARSNPGKRVVFLGIGFETTAPTIASAVKHAVTEGVHNFFVLNALKTMPEAMKALLTSGELALNAFICPGHVSVITGLDIYKFIARDFKTPCVVSGFEPLDLLQSILMITRQCVEGRAEVENQYTRGAKWEGNDAARKLLDEVFAPADSEWRGLGKIPGSGLVLRGEYTRCDAAMHIPVKVEASRENPACICGAIMRGVKKPTDCSLVNKVCSPEDPKGSCMVSEEGSCATYFKYARGSQWLKQ